MSLYSYPRPALEIDEKTMDSGDPALLRAALTRAIEFGNEQRLRLTNVRKVHTPSKQNPNYCTVCFEKAPCATVRATEGENF